MAERKGWAPHSGRLCLLYRHCDSEATMARRIMGFWDKVLLLVVALCLTVSGTNVQCGKQEQDAFMGCVLPHLSSFMQLAVGSVCNRKLITEDLCQRFATFVRCVNGINTSSACRRDAVTQIKKQINSACKLDDLQDVCTEAPALDIGEAIHTTTSSSKAVKVQTMESTSVGDDESSFKGTGSAAVPQVSMVLIMIHMITLTIVL